jgi:hypothetical protein
MLYGPIGLLRATVLHFRECSAICELFGSGVMGSLGELVMGSRLVGSELRAWHRLWTDYGAFGNYRLTCGLPTIQERMTRCAFVGTKTRRDS